MKKIIVLLMLVFIGALQQSMHRKVKVKVAVLNVKPNVMQKKLGRK